MFGCVTQGVVVFVVVVGGVGVVVCVFILLIVYVVGIWAIHITHHLLVITLCVNTHLYYCVSLATKSYFLGLNQQSKHSLSKKFGILDKGAVNLSKKKTNPRFYIYGSF